MNNEKLYKSVEERSRAYRAFCAARRCESCNLKEDKMVCSFKWLKLKAEIKPDKNIEDVLNSFNKITLMMGVVCCVAIAFLLMGIICDIIAYVGR